MARILVIDDSAMSRKMLRSILERAGHQIFDAADGMCGIEAYFLEKPELVTLDLTMSGISGMVVLEKLTAMDSTAKIIVASADIQTSSRELAMKGGACGFISKPFLAETVLTEVERVLKGGTGEAER